MRRRRFIAGVGSAAWPLAVCAQSAAKAARVAVLTGLAENDPATVGRLRAFREGLAGLGWREGQNLVIDVRFEPTSDERADRLVAELVALKPDVAVMQGFAAAAAMQRASPTPPVVFIAVPDPVSVKLVESLARPGGNTTGLTSTEPSFGAKWIDLLRQVAPEVRRVQVVTHLTAAFYKPEIERAAGHFGLEVAYAVVDSPTDIAAAITGFAAKPAGGLVLPTDFFTAIHRKQIIALAMQHKLPLITGNPPFPQDGGLIYYGADFFDLYRRAPSYVDRILRGARPGELPVQQPTSFQMVINLKTAAALGLTVSPALRARADEVID